MTLRKTPVNAENPIKRSLYRLSNSPQKNERPRSVVPKATVLVLGLFFIVGVSHSSGADMVAVNKADNGREIRVAAGDTIRVDLEQSGGAGYTWEIQDPDTEHFEVLKTETTGRPGPGDFVGAPVTRRWLLLAKKDGREELRFLHYRPWEGKESAVETFVLKVQIQ